MKTLHFNDIEKFGYELLGKFEHYTEKADEFLGVSIVAHFKPMKEILNWLVKNTDFELYSINLNPEVVDNYYNEWILTINEKGELWCQVAKHNTRYVYDESDIIFVHSDVNSAFAVKNKGENLVEFSIGEDTDYEDDLDTDISNTEHTYISRDSKGNILGFSKSLSTSNNGVNVYSSYSCYSNSLEELKEIAEEFGVEL